MYGNFGDNVESIDLSKLNNSDVKKISHVQEDIEDYIFKANFGNVNF